MSIADHKYVSFTTFKKNGDAVPSPVWIAPLGIESAGFTTDADSGKVKRLRNNPTITLQPCDMRGRVKADQPVVEATAVFVTGAEATPVVAAIKKKYGFPVMFIGALDALRRFVTRKKAVERAAVVITLPAAES